MAQVRDAHFFSPLSVGFLFFLLLPTLGQAQSLMIFDCQGFTRAIQKVQPNMGSRLELQVQGAESTQSAQVTITNNVTGQTLTAQAQNGVAVFENIPPGSFTVGATGANTTLGAVSIAPMTVSTAAATAAVGTTTVVGGGAAAGGAVVVDDTLNLGITAPANEESPPQEGEPGSGDPLDPVEPDPETPPVEEPPPTTGEDGGGGSECTTCAPDEDPPSLNEEDFFGPPLEEGRMISPAS